MALVMRVQVARIVDHVQKSGARRLGRDGCPGSRSHIPAGIMRVVDSNQLTLR
jgi:hypothetical protein